MILENQTAGINLRAGKKSTRGTFALRLTSMIDMFTILLVFLLKSYSADGQIMTVAPDLRLPESTSQAKPPVVSVIALTREWILVDGRPVQRLDEIKNDDKLLIPSLQAELARLRQITEGIGQLSQEMRGFSGSIAIQGDQDTTFDLLKRIMLTCGRVGYNDMNLAVVEKE